MEEKARALMNAVYKEENKEKIDTTREEFTKITTYILENLKDSREKSLALTKLEEACMWAIKSITREEQNMEEKIEVEYTIPNEDYVEEYDEVVEDEQNSTKI